MSYHPRPGSKTETLIKAVLAKAGTPIRSGDLATLTGVPSASIMSCLQGAVDAGIVTACKVEVPGKRDCWEYRRGSGLPPPSSTPEIGTGTPKPAASTRRVVGAQPPKALLPAAPAPEAAMPPKRASAQTKPVRGEIGIQIDNEGTLTLATEERVMELDAAQTLALGDFLHGCESLWRP